MSKHGPNVTKLITKFIAREAVPPGGGLASALEFFGNAEQRKKVLDAAETKAIQAIQLIKSAPDNPFGDDDEKIASEILEQIQERQLTRRAADLGGTSAQEASPNEKDTGEGWGPQGNRPSR